MALFPVASFSLRAAAATLLLALLVPAAPAASEHDENRVALDYYRALAERGSADAQLVLGDLYRNGDGVTENPVEAYAWYYLAAQQGIEEAVVPMNEVLRALPEELWPLAKLLAERYEKRFIPEKQ